MYHDEHTIPPSEPHGVSPTETDSYDYFPLDVREDIRLLPDEHELVINRMTGQFMLVNWERRRLLVEAIFTEQVCCVMQTLLEGWPSYVPYERVLQVMHPQELPHHIVQEIETARREEAMDTVLEPVRTLLEACQERMNRFGIKLVAVYEHGYLLIALDR